MKFSKKAKAFLLSAVLVTGVAAMPAAEAAKMDDGVHITLYYTVDLAGHVEAGDGSIGLGRIVALIRSAKDKDDDVLAFDVGNTFSGTPLIDARQGEAMAPLMNLAGYDAMSPAVADFKDGGEHLALIASRLNFPLLTTNVLEKSSGQPLFLPYKVFDMDGVRVAVIGLTTGAVPSGKDLDALTFSDPVEAAKREVELLRDKSDVVIALTNFGAEKPAETAKTETAAATAEDAAATSNGTADTATTTHATASAAPAPTAATPAPAASAPTAPATPSLAERLAKEVPGLDIVIDGGSDGTAALAENSADVPLVTSVPWYGKAVGRVTFVVADGKLTQKKAEILSGENVEMMAPDEDDTIRMALGEIRDDAKNVKKDEKKESIKSDRKDKKQVEAEKHKKAKADKKQKKSKKADTEGQ